MFTLRVTLDDTSIRLQHAFADKCIRYDEIASARLHVWTGEYVVRGKDGTKIVFPTWLESAAYVFERCQPTRALDDEAERTNDHTAQWLIGGKFH